MVRSLAEIATRSTAACCHHVVGAGVGAKKTGTSEATPRLTLLVKAAVPRRELVAAVRWASGGEDAPDFDVLEVGDVKALEPLK